jgi:hypothetical protein
MSTLAPSVASRRMSMLVVGPGRGTAVTDVCQARPRSAGTSLRTRGRPSAELDDIEVEFDDLVLGEFLLEQQREDRLLQLSRQRLVPFQVEVLRELHRDRARTANEAPGLHVVLDGLGDRLVVEAAM